MGKTPIRVIGALLIGLVLPITTGNQVATAAGIDNGVLGDSCTVKYISRLIAADSTGTSEVAGVCFPSINNPDIFIWSKDNNAKPAYTMVTDNDGKIAFGRICVIKDANTCSMPDPITDQYLAAEPFVKQYPDTRHVDTLGGIWWSDSYNANIVGANYLSPEVAEDDVAVLPVENESSKQAVSSTLLIGLAALVSLSTSAAPISTQSPATKPASSDAPELLRARRERRFATSSRGGSTFLSSIISMDRWYFFTLKVPALIRKIAKFSSPAATSIGDADYLRAVFGIFSLLLYPIALLIGFKFNSYAENSQVIPEIKWIFAALILGSFDSLAGAVSALTFISLNLTSNLSSTSLDLKKYLATLILIFITTTGPSLFAGALRRFDGVHTNRKGRWERLVDYALSPIVTAWVVWKGLELLPKIIGLEPENWADDIKIAAVIVFLCIFIRYVIEGLVAKHLSDRINEIVTESVPMQKWPKITQQLRKAVWISYIAGLLLTPNEVINCTTLILFILLLIPGVAVAFGVKPNEKLARFNFVGTPRLAILLLTGLLLQSVFTKQDWSRNKFLFFIIAFAPILYFNLLEALTDSQLKSPVYFYQTQQGRLIYRFGALTLYIFILYIIYTQVG